MTNFLSRYLQPVLLYFLFCLFIVTIEMRPGRVYQVLQMLLFRDSVMSLLLYLAVFGFTSFALYVALFSRSRLIRAITIALWLPTLFISLIYRFISGYNYNYADAHTVLNNVQLFGSAFSNYTLPILLALVGAILVGIVLYFIVPKAKYTFNSAYSLLILPCIFISYWYINRSLGVFDDLPALYRVPLSTLVAHHHSLPQYPRELVTVKPTGAGVKHLFMLVDESITGSVLSLNGNENKTTPYLKHAQTELQNFGIAAAYTNYSAGSNIALMSGLQPEDLPDLERRSLKAPSIFQYAKQAGYTTYFVDMQMGRGILQNFMSPYDLQSIDHYVFVTEDQLNQPYYERDFYIADLLLQLSRSKEKVFVYANKVGAHWPYARTYPPDSAFFKPVLSERSMLKDELKSTNTYYNSIRWSVDSFWQKLIQQITPQDSTYIVYTSDHGQDLSGSGISITHARSVESTPVEANVPLWCLDKTGYTSSMPMPAPNQQAHSQIFPTLLMLQGYDLDFIKFRYGPTLYDAPPSSRFFLSGDIFGRGPHTLTPFRF